MSITKTHIRMESSGEPARSPDASRSSEAQCNRGSVWSAVDSAPISDGTSTDGIHGYFGNVFQQLL